MTDPQTPATEAGRQMLDRWGATVIGGEDPTFTQWTAAILATETEARAEHWNEGYRAGYPLGRADALREAAERVRALRSHTHGTMADWLTRQAVLAILDPETKR